MRGLGTQDVLARATWQRDVRMPSASGGSARRMNLQRAFQWASDKIFVSLASFKTINGTVCILQSSTSHDLRTPKRQHHSQAFKT